MAATLSGTTRKDFPPSLEENCTEGKNSTAEEVLGKKKEYLSQLPTGEKKSFEKME